MPNNFKPKHTRCVATHSRPLDGDQERINKCVELRKELMADLNDARRFGMLVRAVSPTCGLPYALEEVLDAAIELTEADFGNIQLLGPGIDTLKIVVQRGLTREFLEYFAQVHDGEAACGTAMKKRQRVVVQDIACDPVFENPRTIETLLAAQVRAVQSTPLVSRSGAFLGVLSTHYRLPRRPSQRQLRGLDLIVRVASDLVEWTANRPWYEVPVEPARRKT